jgi:hypothetical protein
MADSTTAAQVVQRSSIHRRGKGDTIVTPLQRR